MWRWGGALNVSPFGLVVPAWISVWRLCRSLQEEMIKSHRVRVNHELFTEWIISQLHTERCGAWRDENSALCWHHCSVITHWKSCYLQTIPQTLKVANSCCLCCLVSLSVSPCCLPPRSPGSLFVHLVTKYHYLSLSVCHRQENVFLTWKKISLRMMAYWGFILTSKVMQLSCLFFSKIM